MADPQYELREHLTLVNYALDDRELDVIIALLQQTGLSTVSAVLDLALWKLGMWYDVPLPRTRSIWGGAINETDNAYGDWRSDDVRRDAAHVQPDV